MKAPSTKPLADQPPSRTALRTAYELILTTIWPRMVSPTQSTCRRVDDEDSIDTKWTDHRD